MLCIAAIFVKHCYTTGSWIIITYTLSSTWCPLLCISLLCFFSTFQWVDIVGLYCDISLVLYMSMRGSCNKDFLNLEWADIHPSCCSPLGKNHCETGQLVQVMARHRRHYKALAEPIIMAHAVHRRVTKPQLVKCRDFIFHRLRGGQ